MSAVTVCATASMLSTVTVAPGLTEWGVVKPKSLMAITAGGEAAVPDPEADDEPEPVAAVARGRAGPGGRRGGDGRRTGRRSTGAARRQGGDGDRAQVDEHDPARAPEPDGGAGSGHEPPPSLRALLTAPLRCTRAQDRAAAVDVGRSELRRSSWGATAVGR